MKPLLPMNNFFQVRGQMPVFPGVDEILPMYLHDIGEDHFHEEEGSDSLEYNGLWVSDHFHMTSVGVDIGSASTQVVFSRLTLERMGGALSSRYRVIARESLYRSPVMLTPYRGAHRIDERRLSEIVETAYQNAGIPVDDVDAGAVILTGEAIRRENAKAIADTLSVHGGKFVCAIAGHNMEALLAAYGSGTVELSYRRKARLLNVDIGGGTTKLAVIENGHVLETAAIHVGGRLIATDDHGTVTRIEPGGAFAAQAAGKPVSLGGTMSATDKVGIARWMAQHVLAAIAVNKNNPNTGDLFLTDRLTELAPYDGIVFSGGVAEYIYGLQHEEFGDLGPYLGQEIRRCFSEHPQLGEILPASECIRATVLGASEYSLQISGNTIYLSNTNVLPVRNLQVLHPDCDLHHDIDASRLAEQIRAHLRRFDLREGETEFALSFHWGGSPSYERIRAFCSGLKAALPVLFSSRRQVTIVLDGDIAKTVGRLLKEEFQVQAPLLVLDGILLQDFDFVDIGRLIEPAGVVPVTVKSLVFDMGSSGVRTGLNVH
ncbi:ethanolamine ammonia-lyase reactivating factor EutA [Alicyclobacillus suci]|uniref:ethanolamine ammonia-lyase reactivating factor EutA n=1 Tax=Alicyclobacillus suci TaxID=2816080 RepID=UPI0016628981|nr:ethanolamine ammonia-lyase reactivating factor EutA [Alicyclobacillus suci]